MKIGFIGAGRMGGPMVRFLVKAGYVVTVCDPDPNARARARSHGAAEAPTIKACVLASDIVFSSLPDDKVLRHVTLGPDGVFASASAGLIYIDTSTVSPAASADVAAGAAARGVAYLRMPVSGNSNSAEAGQITALVSGPPPAWEKVKPAVQKFSVAQVYVGEAEQARYMKLVINLLVANSATLMAEALALGRKGGLDWNTMLDGLTASTIGSPWLNAKAKLLKVRDFTPTFTPAQLSKDVDLMLQAGDQLGIPMPMTATTRQLMKATIGDGYGAEDFIAVVKLFERLSGLPTDSV
jgi:3-hydroxyisobutyrate dehydrogenase-like beta-hydroxyacid dehydrogenase